MARTSTCIVVVWFLVALSAALAQQPPKADLSSLIKDPKVVVRAIDGTTVKSLDAVIKRVEFEGTNVRFELRNTLGYTMKPQLHFDVYDAYGIHLGNISLTWSFSSLVKDQDWTDTERLPLPDLQEIFKYSTLKLPRDWATPRWLVAGGTYDGEDGKGSSVAAQARAKSVEAMPLQPQTAQKKPAAPKASTPKLPAAYTFLTREAFGPGGCGGIERLYVRISGKLDETEMKKLAVKIQVEQGNEAWRPKIFFLLPGMELGSAWARADFDPTGKTVTIDFIGPPKGEPDGARTTLPALPGGSSELGVWVDDRYGRFQYMTLYRLAGKEYFQNIYSDGSSGVDEMVEEPRHPGRYRVKDGSVDETYGIIANGDLGLWYEGTLAMKFKRVLSVARSVKAPDRSPSQ